MSGVTLTDLTYIMVVVALVAGAGGAILGWAACRAWSAYQADRHDELAAARRRRALGDASQRCRSWDPRGGAA